MFVTRTFSRDFCRWEEALCANLSFLAVRDEMLRYLMRSAFLVFLMMFLLAGCSEPSEQLDVVPDSGAEDIAELAAAADELGRMAEQVELAQSVTQDQLSEGQVYLNQNAQKSGVKVLKSGLQFEILEQGDGDSPGPTDTVVTHYHGTFINGEVFDSSLERGQPAEFPVNRVIKGWTEALQMMREGDVWRLVIPPDLGYGQRGAGNRIPPNTVLVFEVELIEVKG